MALVDAVPIDRSAGGTGLHHESDGTVRRVFVSDLRHFLDMSDDAPGPARRIAEQLSLIVRAATAGDAGVSWVSALVCKRRPAHRACPGRTEVVRTDVPASIRWRCTSCADEGVISGWEGSPFDLRPRGVQERDDGAVVSVVVDIEVARTLQSLMLLDGTCERLVFRARETTQGVVLTGSADDFEELIGSIAAEANHEETRRRQRALDAAFDMLDAALNAS